MSHSYDRTLVQSLAMDPDRKLPGHDAAVMKLAGVASAVADIVVAASRRDEDYEVVSTRCTLERIVTKGEGAFRAHIGFVDLVIEASIKEPCRCRPACRRHGTGDAVWHTAVEQIAVEVKTSRVSVGDLLRQINLYREYLQGRWLWACWANCTYSEQEVAMLKAQRVVVLEGVR